MVLYHIRTRPATPKKIRHQEHHLCHHLVTFFIGIIVHFTTVYVDEKRYQMVAKMIFLESDFLGVLSYCRNI